MLEEARLERNGLSTRQFLGRSAVASSTHDDCARDITGAVESVVADFVETYQVALGDGRAMGHRGP